ncbi:bifunctional adenosylcobinamide kinase/adenosylcobinamide-phosphate guanylyltransferase [Frigidibacter sp. ROC022]|uniref:bifunctional adenosylcobinamide kinase/adenosylcobinamide-phosphate guanylyltransferase n=1 Tax=Frigidibacter sp. ROC022 TaxID=2971796 RepID=UPI00215B5B7E|nr:bifunctional adenosylcobinamide kinase/adenosylcobinamide-phosphate guanylyltransferase [Frigidibacter sp. ROC022]MCR8724015.1 bifunctional adenosylcobinamide kinase/adenosylcobinamide-phosphate guanylyltransferase [Frigidibacter sp. ROC022]
MTLKNLSLVLGGASSGKSGFAETLVTGSGRARVYIATAQAHDAEMQARITAHRQARGPDWRTVEAPLEPGAALATVAEDEIALLDCATLWLSNLMLAGADLAEAERELMQALDDCPAPVVVVSNEVGGGVVPDNALARRFRAAQGGLNQRLAARADLAVLVVAGLPLVLKGALP